MIDKFEEGMIYRFDCPAYLGQDAVFRKGDEVLTLEKAAPGQPCRVTFQRGGETKTVLLSDVARQAVSPSKETGRTSLKVA